MTVPRKQATANYVPAAAVIRRWRALSGLLGVRACRREDKSDVKFHGLTVALHLKLFFLSDGEESRNS